MSSKKLAEVRWRGMIMHKFDTGVIKHALSVLPAAVPAEVGRGFIDRQLNSVLLILTTLTSRSF